MKALNWCLEKKVDIVNISLKCSENDETKLAIKSIVNAGVFVICGAGNYSDLYEKIVFPACMKETIAVGSLAENFKLARSSSEGQVDIVAPGVNIWSTYPDQRYSLKSGTSMASAFVSGVVALALSKHRFKDPDSETPIDTIGDLRKHLKLTANHTVWDFQPGMDAKYGHGLIDPVEMVTGAREKELSFELSDFSKAGLAKLKELPVDLEKLHIRALARSISREPIFITIKTSNNE